MANLGILLTKAFGKVLPIKKKTVLFSAFGGQYNDNPKAISIKLHEKDSTIKQIWVKSDKSREEFPDYCYTVQYGSKEYYQFVTRAQVVVDNHVGLRVNYRTKKDLRSFFQTVFARKRKGQLCISTWHGTPLKRIGRDEIGSKLIGFESCSDYVLAGCGLTADALKTSHFNTVPVKKYGTPRNDIFFTEISVRKLKEKLGLPLDKKLVIFAPTFRTDVDRSGVIQMNEFNFEKILSSLQNKFGGEWSFVFRVHQLVLKKIAVDEIVKKYGGVLVNGNLHDDMAEYLACSDALITDYSGAMFDFALTKKPCFLYAFDREHYEREERGFYLGYDELPFPQSTTCAELVKSIDNFDEDEYRKKLEDFMIKIDDFEKGKASEKVVEDIIDYIYKTDKKESCK